MWRTILYIIDSIAAPARRREEARLKALREDHFRWREVPYGKPVQIKLRRFITDPPVGTVGIVLSEAEHGISRFPGYATVEPAFPGIRGYHVQVKFGTTKSIIGIGELAPA